MDYNIFKGLVTHIIDPSNFWMRIGTDNDMNLFSEYQQRLDAFYNMDMTKYTCGVDQMHPGYLVVVAECAKDDGWHWERAQVTRVDSDHHKCDVLFVDLGYTDIVEVDRCRAITPGLFNFLPPQASRVSLGGVKPLSNTWTTRATNLFRKETEEREVLAVLMHYDKVGMCYTVVLYTSQRDGTWRSIIHIMQEEELAVGTNETVKEVLTDDDVQQCLDRMEEKQKTDSENETTLVKNEEEEAEKWDDDQGVGGSDDLMATPMTASADSQYLSKSSSDQHRAVTGYDYRALMRTRTISLSQMQLEKGVETQTTTKTNIARDLQRLESSHSQNDEQDWDTVQDTDFHVDIVSQIYQGVPDRQYSSDDGMSVLFDGSGSKMDKLAASPKKQLVPGAPEVASAATSSSYLSWGTKDLGRHYYYQMEENQDASVQPDNGMNNSNANNGAGDDGFDVVGGDGGLREIERYRLEKQITEILSNPDGLESDYVCASVYGVVEPDLDAPGDLLCAVISAILEYIIQNSCKRSEIAFAILETYSDAIEFGTAMVEVIHELKDQYVKKYHSERLSNRHKEFAVILALVFKHAEDWQEGACKAVQDLAVALVERWVIFNKQRHLSGDELVQCELLYLETAQTFLMESYDLLKVKYSSNLKEIMQDVRFKLLQDQTRRSVRTFLLDMLLTFNPDGRLERVAMCSVRTQTEDMKDVETKSMSAIDIGGGGDYAYENPINNQSSDMRWNQQLPESTPTNTSPYSDHDHASSQLHFNNQPKKVRTLQQRLLAKSQPEHAATLASQPSSSSLSDDTVVHTRQCHRESPNSDTSASSPLTVSNQFSSLSLNDEVVHVQDVSGGDNHCEMQYAPKQNEYTHEKSVFENGKMSLSPRTVTDKITPSHSPSNEIVMDKVPYSNSPQSFLYEEDSDATRLWTPSFIIQDEDAVRVKAMMENTPECQVELTSSDVDSVESKAAIKTTSEKWVKGHVRIERDTTIRYTPRRLRELNTFAGQPKIPLWDLWQPKELLEKMIVVKNPGKAALDDDATKSKINTKWRTSGHSPKMDKKRLGSSVDPSPSPTSARSNHSTDKYSGGMPGKNLYENDGEVYLNKGSGLQGIASDLFKNPGTPTAVVEEEENWNNGEKWDDEDSGKVGGIELEELLKPRKKEPGSGKKAKKKRAREIPFDQYLQEQEAMKVLSEEVDCGVDGSHGDDDDMDFMSPEALKMYEELEKQGVGVDTEMEAMTRVIVPTRFGSHASSTTKRPSLFSSIRQEQPSAQRASKPWAPASRRFCTHCGSKDHVVYDCTERTNRLLQ